MAIIHIRQSQIEKSPQYSLPFRVEDEELDLSGEEMCMMMLMESRRAVLINEQRC